LKSTVNTAFACLCDQLM